MDLSTAVMMAGSAENQGKGVGLAIIAVILLLMIGKKKGK